MLKQLPRAQGATRDNRGGGFLDSGLHRPRCLIEGPYGLLNSGESSIVAPQAAHIGMSAFARPVERLGRHRNASSGGRYAHGGLGRAPIAQPRVRPGVQ